MEWYGHVEQGMIVLWSNKGTKGHQIKWVDTKYIEGVGCFHNVESFETF